MRFTFALFSGHTQATLNKHSLPQVAHTSANHSWNSTSQLVELLYSQKPTSVVHLERRRAIRAELENVLQQWNGRLSIRDVSMYSYACDITQAPMELAIVDDSPTLDLKNTHSSVCDPSSVSRVLQVAGYVGKFHDLYRERKDASLGRRMRGLGRYATLWPVYEDKVEPDELPYPSRLRIYSTPSVRFSFDLILPGPQTLPLYNLLAQIHEKEPAKQFLAVIWTCLRSLGLLHFSTTAVAIMTGQFLQCEPTETTLDDLLRGFLRKWSRISWTRTDIITIQPEVSPLTSYIRRKWLYSKKTCSGERPMRLNPLPHMSIMASEPNAWKLQALIVQDPFIPTKNHAETIHVLDLQRFVRYCRTQTTLASGAPSDLTFVVQGLPVASTRPSAGPIDRKYALVREPLSEPSPEGSLTARSREECPFPTPCQPLAEDSNLVTKVQSNMPNERSLPAEPPVPTTVMPASVSKSSPPSGYPTPIGPERALSSSPLHSKDKNFIFARQLLYIPKEVYRRRMRTIYTIQMAVQKHFGCKYNVELFGSSEYGVSHPLSDLDLVIVDPDRPQGFVPGHGGSTLPSVYSIYKLANAIRKAGFENVQAINATVKIVKFRDPLTGLEGDICVNERLGPFNTRLICTYCKASPLLRPMLILIKYWAKSLGLNSPSPQRSIPMSFSSYALTLMTIGFLQTRGLLPNLQESLPPLPDPPNTNDIFYSRKKREDSVRCDIRYHQIDNWHATAPLQPTLREAMLDWFSFWNDEFLPTEQMISIRHGGLLKDSVPQIPPVVVKASPMRVVDPFIVTQNVSQNVEDAVFNKFLVECLGAQKALQSGVPLKTLVGLDVSPARSQKKEKPLIPS